MVDVAESTSTATSTSTTIVSRPPVLPRNSSGQTASLAVCGTSDNPCSDTYSGPSAASEVETQVMVDAVKERNDNEGGIEIFISIHTYAQFWLIPWGGTTIKPADYDDLVRKPDIISCDFLRVKYVFISIYMITVGRCRSDC